MRRLQSTLAASRLLPLLPLLLLLLNLASPGLAQVDPKVCVETTGTDTLPALPSSFHASLTLQSGVQIGQATILVDANSSRSAVTYGATGNEEFKAIFDSVTRQISVINHRVDQFDIENCKVQNASADSFSSPMAKISFLGSERIIPTGSFFSGAGLKIKMEAQEQANGVPASRYRTCYMAGNLQTTLEVTWWYSVDSKAPVQVKTRHSKPGDAANILETTYVLGPLRSLSSKHDATRLPFAAPRGVYCKGLISIKQAPSTYNRFSLGVDQFTNNVPGQPNQGPISFRESYDQRGNLTMIEGEGLNFALDKAKYGSGRLARINDFTRGISYVKNLRFGNCTYEKIPENSWDTDPSPNGAKIKTPDEFYFPSLSELQYKGTGVYRSTDVDIYIGFEENYVDGKLYPISVEYYMDIKVSYDGTGQPSYKSVPLAAYSASINNINSLVEIFDFNTGIPRSYDHDISDCFSATQKQHFELILSTGELDPSYVRYLNEYRDEFMYSLVTSLSKAVNISPLRIIEPLVTLFAEPLILVEITVSDRANVPGYTPKQPEAPLSQVAAAMTDLAAKGTLVIDVLEGDLVFQVPIKDYVSMDSRGPQSPAPGMSSGAIAGLCIGMVLLGIVIGLAIVFAVGHFRKDPLFGFKPFGATQEA